MTYGTLLSESLEALPEFRREYEELIQEDIIDEEAGMHIVFSYAFTPVLIDSIRGNKNVARKMFAFLEKMASCEDHLVQEVCDYSVIESLRDEIDEKTLLNFMHKTTKEAYWCVKEYMPD